MYDNVKTYYGIKVAPVNFHLLQMVQIKGARIIDCCSNLPLGIPTSRLEVLTSVPVTLLQIQLSANVKEGTRKG